MGILWGAAGLRGVLLSPSLVRAQGTDKTLPWLTLSSLPELAPICFSGHLFSAVTLSPGLCEALSPRFLSSDHWAPLGDDFRVSRG